MLTMHRSCADSVRLGFVAALVLFTGTLAASPASAQIRWRTGASDLSGKTAGQVVKTIANHGKTDHARHLVVQFNEPMTPQRRAELQAAGVSLLSYLGDNAFVASVAVGAVDRKAVANVPSLVDAQVMQRRWKLHPSLLADEIHPWAIVTSAGEEDSAPVVAVYLMFHSDVALVPDGEALVARHQARIQSRLPSVNGLVLELPADQIKPLADEDEVLYIEPPLPKFAELNNSNREITEAEIVQAAPYDLDGSGVSVLVYDGGYALDSHNDFGGRLTVRDSSGLSDHATHVSGTIGGDGSQSSGLYRGMAPGVIIESYGFEQDGGLQEGFLYSDPGDLDADYSEAITQYGVDISNNSIGTNTAINGFPCEWTGDYGVTSALIDSIVSGSTGAPFRIVWANGNERQTSRCGDTFQTTAPPACAKNHLTVGALNSNDDSVTGFTSWGPADDDRLKPDVSAPGCQSDDDFDVTSCSSSGGYTGKCGTSMASPTACGLAALLLEDFRALFPGEPDFRNSTLRAMFAHNAEDIENPGPDYKTGYGSLRIQRTIDFLRTENFFEAQMDQGGTLSVLVVVNPGDTELKVTIAWDDPPAAPLVSAALVNDLDLRVFDPSGGQHFPWTLGGVANPSAPAVRTQPDRVNNIEQVVVDSPTPGVWVAEVHGFNVPQGPQVFSLCASPELNACSSAGLISLDVPAYSCDDTAEIRVIDCDLNTDDGVVETVDVTIASDTEPGGETVTLTETAAETADFRGTIPLQAIDLPASLQVADGDTITATYIDDDDGSGGTMVTVTATATTDCSGPVISNIQITEISSDSAKVTFDTDEAALGTVRYGLSCGSFTDSVSEEGFGTSHELVLTGLTHSTDYSLLVEAEDEQGNVSTDDAGGDCYAFSTLFVLFDFPLDTNPGWGTEGAWAFGQPTGGGSHDGDPTSGRTGDNVYGYNLFGDYPDDLPATYLTTTSLDFGGWTDVHLKFWRWLGVESGSDFDEATIEVSNNGTNWTVIWRATDGGVDISDSAWTSRELDISALADNQSTVFVRWGMGPTDGGTTFPGWNVDDVQFIATGGPLTIIFPNGLPNLIAPGLPADIDVRITGIDETYVPGTAFLHYRFDAGAFQTVPLTALGGELFTATLPPAACSDAPEYYFSAEGTESGVVLEPPTAPSSTFTAQVGEVAVIFETDFESATGWTVENVDLDDGAWDRGVPVDCDRGDPPTDFDGSGQCWLTDNSSASSCNSDVDGGPTRLISPLFDFSDSIDPVISYARWFNNNDGDDDRLDVEISDDDGQSWSLIESVTSSSSWFMQSVRVTDHTSLTSQAIMRFSASDNPNDSVTEAGIDAFSILDVVCDDVDEPLAPNDVTVVRGQVQSGGLDQLGESDDDHLVIRRGFALGPFDPPVRVVLTATAATASPSQLRFALEASVDTPGVLQTIELFNYDTQGWEEVDARAATTTDTVAVVVVTGDPARFIDPDTLETKAQTSWRATGPILFFAWQIQIDHAGWTVVE